MVVHLINITGFSGNTYFKPHIQDNLEFTIRTRHQYKKAFSLITGKPVEFISEQDHVHIKLEHLDQFDSIVLE
jgi:hypothetical protein